MAESITFPFNDKKITLTGGSGKVKFLRDLDNPDFRIWLDVTTEELKKQSNSLNLDSLQDQAIEDYAKECHDNLPLAYKISTTKGQCENALQSCIKLFQFVELVKVLYAHGEGKYVENLSGFEEVRSALKQYENNQSDGGNPYDGKGGMVDFFKLNDKKNNSNPVKEYLSKHMSKFFTQRDDNTKIIGGECFFESPTEWMAKYANEYNQDGYTTNDDDDTASYHSYSSSSRSNSTESRSNSTASSDSFHTCIGLDDDRYTFYSACGQEEPDSPSNLRASVAGLKEAMKKTSKRYRGITNQNALYSDNEEVLKNNIMTISDGPTRRLLIEQYALIMKATAEIDKFCPYQVINPEDQKLDETLIQSYTVYEAFTKTLEKNSTHIPPSCMGRICRWLSDLIDKMLGKTFSKLDKKTYDRANLESRLKTLSKRIQDMDENLSNNRNSPQSPSN